MRVTVCCTVSASSQLNPGGAGGRCGVGSGAGVGLAAGRAVAAVPALGRSLVGTPTSFGVGLGRGFATVPAVGAFASGGTGPCSTASSVSMQMNDLTLAS